MSRHVDFKPSFLNQDRSAAYEMGTFPDGSSNFVRDFVRHGNYKVQSDSNNNDESFVSSFGFRAVDIINANSSICCPVNFKYQSTATEFAMARGHGKLYRPIAMALVAHGHTAPIQGLVQHRDHATKGALSRMPHESVLSNATNSGSKIKMTWYAKGEDYQDLDSGYNYGLINIYSSVQQRVSVTAQMTYELVHTDHLRYHNNAVFVDGLLLNPNLTGKFEGGTILHPCVNLDSADYSKGEFLMKMSVSTLPTGFEVGRPLRTHTDLADSPSQIDSFDT